LSTQADADLCRITLVAPRVRLDVAVPATVPLAGLLPTLLSHIGEQTAEEGAVHGGWAVQRLGEAPLDTERSITALRIRDGEVLYLRPRQDALPAATFDDPVDAMGTALLAGRRRWTPAATGVAGLTAAAALLATGCALPLFVGPPWIWSAWAYAVGAVVLLSAAALVSRAFHQTAGTVLSAAASPYAFAGGVLALADHHTLGRLGAPQVLVGFAAALVAAVVAMAVLDRLEPTLLGIALVSVFGAIGAAVSLGLGPAAGAATALAAELLTVPAVPAIAYRVARLPRPELPLTPEELRKHGEPLPGEDIGRRALAADGMMTAAVSALGALAPGCVVVMLRQSWAGSAWAALAISAVAVVSLPMRARLFAGLVQRIWLLGGALAATAALAYRLTVWFGRPAMVLDLVGLAVAAGVSAAWAVRPRRRVAAPWARRADLLEFVLTAALVPLALELLRVYTDIHSLTG
jgi:type VII secretion integral membrane protein EccD